MNMLRDYVHSYKDLPVAVYQFQIKLRNELRAKSGIMRGREFLMKDMYSVLLNLATSFRRFVKQVRTGYIWIEKGISPLTRKSWMMRFKNWV